MARLLTEAAGSLELVDMADKFPGLHWLPGLQTWNVWDSEMNQHSDLSTVPAHLATQVSPMCVALETLHHTAALTIVTVSSKCKAVFPPKLLSSIQTYIALLLARCGPGCSLPLPPVPHSTSTAVSASSPTSTMTAASSSPSSARWD